MTTDGHEGQVKIRVPLLGSARQSGFESESLWAEPLGNNRYRIWNLPVFAYNLEMRAIVECAQDPDGGLPVAIRVLEPGDCYVVRLYFHDGATDAQIQDVLDVLSSRRALFEKYNRRLWAVGLRSRQDFEWAGPALKRFVDADVLTLESAFQPNEPVLGGRLASLDTRGVTERQYQGSSAAQGHSEAGMEITYSGRFSRRDLFTIDRAASRVLGRGSVIQTTVYSLLAAIVLISFAGFAAVRGSSDAATQWLFVAAIPAALFTFNIIAIRRAYSRHPLAGVQVHGVLSESGFELSMPDAPNRIGWPVIARVGTSADYLLLETRGQELYALPRKFFSSAQEFASACSIAQRCVGPAPASPLVIWRRVFVWSAVIVAIIAVFLFWSLWR